ncbi:transcriptional regulator of arginine metabolism [Lachnospiraceae bacterium PF1-21]|uniref:Arginine repressor n=1 Tax=Ohessyouella blattaphilus TaxID=2949333 RepID=A0ABT1EL85_9FIRM|nr:arginine repressor [Ohessyouella blattaphilus]MCP1111229.1 arginine repressor [Ohessyouella blattaphilus]MCR8564623.1 arginine repressor [Ohessyouella blattaphilus]
MKGNRRQKIIELINKYEIETQEDLTEHLRLEGITTTQATISRDIRDLKLTKVPTANGRHRYGVLEPGKPQLGEKFIRVLKEGFLSMEVAGNLLVIKTVSGMAMAVAAAIDSLEYPEVAGCIAGDDTLMCAIKSEDGARVVEEKIRKILV